MRSGASCSMSVNPTTGVRVASPPPAPYTGDMSLAELLFALLLVCLVAGMAVVVATVSGIGRRAEARGVELARLRSELTLGGRAQESATSDLREQLGQTQTLLEGMRAVFVSRQQLEEDARRSLRRLEAVIARSAGRGPAGENILEESLRHLPPDMVQRNVWIGGRVVEFGLTLPGGKILPID